MEKLKEVLSIQSESYNQWRMFAYIIRQLQDIPDTDYFVVNGNIYIQRGDADTYPCMVAHMDTVHDIVEDLHPVYINGNITGFNRVTMEQTGIGGDDKVGIYIALECLRTFDNIKIAFFRDEEVGCVGSYDAHMHFFKDCRFVLQCDRKGNKDFVTDASGVELSSKAFQDDILPIIGSFGYSFAHGMMTDVMALKESGIRCSVANMSCGYYNPHCHTEYVNVADVENCLDMCKTIIRTCTSVYKHKYKPRWSTPKSYSYTAKSYTPAKAQPTNDRIYWEDDFGYDKRIYGETYCSDCWGAEAVHDNGLCDSCNNWYKRDLNMKDYKDHNDIF